MLKKPLLIILPAILLIIGCQPKEQISGTLNNLLSDTLIVCVMNESCNRTERLDTIPAIDGKFAFSLKETTTRMIIIGTKPKPGKKLFEEGGQLTMLAVPEEKAIITGTIEDYNISGSKFYKDLAKAEEPIKSISKKIAQMRDSYMEQMKKAENKDSLNNAFEQKYKQFTNEIATIAKEYVTNNPDNNVSGYMVTMLGENIYDGIDLLTEKVKTGVIAPYMNAVKGIYDAQKIRKKAAENIVAGKPAPDFTLKDLTGKDLSLSSLRGKYLVLDFWGSWCGWCIKGIPEMKAAYAKHKNKIEFLGIACNDTEEKWKKAVADNELPWLNVINSNTTDVSALYAIEGYPTKIIINPDGTINKVVVGEDPEFYEYLANLLK